MSRPLLLSLLLVPVAIFGEALGLPGWLLFFTSLGAIVPLAAVISAATEQVALAKGSKVGGALNATFGNVPDLFVGYFGVKAGLLTFVKATMIGAIISNAALILGLSFLVAGLRHGFVRFDAREAGRHTVLMLLAVAAMLLPSVAAATLRATPALEELSDEIAIILLLSYLAYVAFSIFGWTRAESPEARSAVLARPLPETSVDAADPPARWPLWVSLAVLIVAAGLLAPIANVLVDAVTPAVHALGWTDAFVGVIVVANAGNASELYAAVRMGARGRLNLSLQIASGSSIQIAAFVTPVVVLLSLAWHPMDLVFRPIELAIVGLTVAVAAYIAHDGETNWLEGFQLVAIYAMAAAVFYVLPGA
ncbi:MAG: calcium/proton exchanger [Chloroflexota bacterium]